MSTPIPARQPSFTSPPATPSPRRPSALAGGTTAEQRRARREQFRSFYGLKPGSSGQAAVEEPGAGAGAGDEAKSTGPKGDPLDLNSPSFDAATYYEDLIKKSSLAELMQSAAGMSADINNLQSSRHSLVYNHHHQLFAAGDTISHLNSRTPQLLAIMTSLQDSFSSISQLADSVAMPAQTQTGEEREEDGEGRIPLEEGLKRVQLMLRAESDPAVIRRLWDQLDREDISDEELRSRIADLQRQVDALPETPATEEQQEEAVSS